MENIVVISYAKKPRQPALGTVENMNQLLPAQLFRDLSDQRDSLSSAVYVAEVGRVAPAKYPQQQNQQQAKTRYDNYNYESNTYTQVLREEFKVHTSSFRER